MGGELRSRGCKSLFSRKRTRQVVEDTILNCNMNIWYVLLGLHMISSLSSHEENDDLDRKAIIAIFIGYLVKKKKV